MTEINRPEDIYAKIGEADQRVAEIDTRIAEIEDSDRRWREYQREQRGALAAEALERWGRPTNGQTYIKMHRSQVEALSALLGALRHTEVSGLEPIQGAVDLVREDLFAELGRQEHARSRPPESGRHRRARWGRRRDA